MKPNDGYDIYSERDFKPCGDDYVESVGTELLLLLKRQGMVRGVRVSVNRDRALVQVGLPKPLAGFWEQTTDCQAGFEANLEPQFLAMTAVKELMENIQRAQSGGN